MANDLESLDFLVLDEADRMIETGHFAELDSILRLTLQQNRSVLWLHIWFASSDVVVARTTTTPHWMMGRLPIL